MYKSTFQSNSRLIPQRHPNYLFAAIIIWSFLSPSLICHAKEWLPFSPQNCVLKEPAAQRLQVLIQKAYGDSSRSSQPACDVKGTGLNSSLRSLQETANALSAGASPERLNQFAMDLWEQSIMDLLLTRISAEMHFKLSGENHFLASPEQIVDELCIDKKDNHTDACASGSVNPGVRERLRIAARKAIDVYQSKKTIPADPATVVAGVNQLYAANTQAARLLNQVTVQAYPPQDIHSDRINEQSRKLRSQNAFYIQNSPEYQSDLKKAKREGEKIKIKTWATHPEVRQIQSILFTQSLQKKTLSPGVQGIDLESKSSQPQTVLVPVRITEAEAEAAIREYRAAPATIAHEMSRNLILARMPNLGSPPSLHAKPLTGWLDQMMNLHPQAVAKLIKRMPEYGPMICPLLKDKDAGEALNRKMDTAVEGAMFATIIMSGGSLAPGLLGIELSAEAAAGMGSVMAVQSAVGTAAMGASLGRHLAEHADLSRQLDLMEQGILSRTGIQASDLKNTKVAIAETESDLTLDAFFIGAPYLGKLVRPAIQEARSVANITAEATTIRPASLSELTRKFANSPKTAAGAKLMSLLCGVLDTRCGVMMVAFHGLSAEKQTKVLTEPKEMEKFVKELDAKTSGKIKLARPRPAKNALLTIHGEAELNAKPAIDEAGEVQLKDKNSSKAEDDSSYVSFTDPKNGKIYFGKIVGYLTRGAAKLPMILYPSGTVLILPESQVSLLEFSPESRNKFSSQNTKLLEGIQTQNLSSVDSYISYVKPGESRVVYAKVIGYETKRGKVTPKVMFLDGSTLYLDENRLQNALSSATSRTKFQESELTNSSRDASGEKRRIVKDVKDLPTRKDILAALDPGQELSTPGFDFSKAKKIKLVIYRPQITIHSETGKREVMQIPRKVDGYLLSEGVEETKIGKMAKRMNEKFGTQLVYSAEANRSIDANAYYNESVSIYDEEGNLLSYGKPIINAYKSTMNGKNSDTNIHELGHMKTNENRRTGKMDPLAVSYHANNGEALPHLEGRKTFYSKYSQADESRQHAMNFWNATHQRPAVEVKADFDKNKQLKIVEAFGVTTKNYLDAIDEAESRLANLKTLNFRGTKLNGLAKEVIEKGDRREAPFTLSKNRQFAFVATPEGQVKIPLVGQIHDILKMASGEDPSLSREQGAKIEAYLIEYLKTGLDMFAAQQKAIADAGDLMVYLKANPDQKIDYGQFLKYQDQLGRVKTSVNLKNQKKLEN